MSEKPPFGKNNDVCTATGAFEQAAFAWLNVMVSDTRSGVKPETQEHLQKFLDARGDQGAQALVNSFKEKAGKEEAGPARRDSPRMNNTI